VAHDFPLKLDYQGQVSKQGPPRQGQTLLNLHAQCGFITILSGACLAFA
jgi:hypothetical protein